VLQSSVLQSSQFFLRKVTHPDNTYGISL
jgi:hypothetical protein